MSRYNSREVSEKQLFSYITIAWLLSYFCVVQMTRTAIHIAEYFFHGRSIFWKTLLFSLPSLLDFFTFVLILNSGDCNVDIFEQVIYYVNGLVLCRISTTLALWPAEILTVYTIVLVTRCFP